MVQILKKKNNILYFKLEPIITKEKPGELIDLNLKNICKNLDIQFQMSKCFYINELNSDLSRGKHSNNNCTELLICLTGTFDIKLHNGKKVTIINMKKNEGIFINKNIWIDFYNFKDCIIIAFVDIDFDEEKKSCYDFNDFLNKFK